MAGRKPFTFPEIADADVDWACSLLKLRADAFCGAAGNDPRLAVLKSPATIDVAACPGSGKTTLLVAKLAILARRWPHRDQGMCVLSHTNVARQEIETRLGGTTEGRRLMAYPHHVGTIHGFINTYIAVPWLRSQGLPVTRIDDSAVQRRRWFKLDPGHRNALTRSEKTDEVLRIQDPDFSLGDISWGRGRLGHDTPLYRAMQDACRASIQEGGFCYEEMFIFAHDALNRMPGLAESVRQRFPLLFVDEVQDNNEAQSRLLHRLFTEGEAPSVRQRFGDMNQAIFGRSDDAHGAESDPFPDPRTTIDIPNSHRFGQVIASAADPFGLAPSGLVGLGPGRDEAEHPHSPLMLLFDPVDARRVLPLYARHLGQVFDEAVLKTGVFTAIGAVHRDGAADRSPRSVGHYWQDYDHQLSPLDPKAETFLQHILVGVGRMAPTGDVRPLADKVAEGIIELARLADPTWRPASRRHPHRQVLELLSHNARVRSHYVRLVTALAEGRLPTTGASWDTWTPSIRNIAIAVAGAATAAWDDEGFLVWQDGALADGEQAAPKSRTNIFQCPDDPRVNIRVGSIHSVKGETHTATLVLETFYYEHHLRRLKPWLLGSAQGRGRNTANSRIGVGLKQHYVAMTRPSHLLALAMRAEDFSPAEISVLRSRNWRVAHVGETELEWT